MTDSVISQSQDGENGKASYSFIFQFDNGSGLKKMQNIDVLFGEAPDLATAFTLAKQRAANSKKKWTDGVAQVSMIGPVSLPPPV